MSLYADLKNKKTRLAVIGLGYVGLPLALEFGKRVRTIGFDADRRRIAELTHGIDRNGELSAAQVRASSLTRFTADEKELAAARFFIVAVPTPVNAAKRPDLSFVKAASAAVGRRLRKGSLVVFEPTVYPGVTENICVPILERASGLKCGRDFKVGYSPERINPGDKHHTVSSVVKIVSAMDGPSLEEVAKVYGLVVRAGVFKADSIQTAEAAKVVENIQRDLNIALMNELALIFHRMGIDTRSVIEAAGSKWNFIKFFPGLVGGHCIDVDPYYLTFRAEQLGYHPQVILSGRRVNASMGRYVAKETLALLKRVGRPKKGARVLVLGVTFKENVSDVRNSRVFDIVRELKKERLSVTVCDPHADPAQIEHEYGVRLTRYSAGLKADAVVIAVPHRSYREKLTPKVLLKHLVRTNGGAVLVDVKGMLDRRVFEGTGVRYWRL